MKYLLKQGVSTPCYKTKKLFIALPLLFFMASCGDTKPDTDNSCTTGSDCKNGLICVDFLCVEETSDEAIPSDEDHNDDFAFSDNTVDIDDSDATEDDETIDETTDEDSGLSEEKDSDGDGISDAVEGDVDTDGDGTPDYLDTDSDNDTIPDKTETPNGVVVDTDSDGTPDYKDTDSDNDTILDSIEGTDDVDGDGASNYRDEDSDDDYIPDSVEVGVSPGAPVDSEGDGTPDYLDTDSDNDTIEDKFEGVRDSDGDLIPNYLDTDSDNDTIPDVTERGGDAIPLDTDKDKLFDFEDADSDSDGLGDIEEKMCPTLGKDGRLFDDVDGDGFSDLAEVAVGSDVCDPNEGVTDMPGIKFYFELPYKKPQKTDILTFSPQVSEADIWFNIDTTGSMRKEIENLKYSLSTTIIPGVRERIPNAYFALSQFRDENEVSLIQADPTDNFPVVQNAVNKLRAASGDDCPEAGLWSLFKSVDEGKWRDKAIPIMIHITDAPSHERGGHDATETIAKLNDNGVRVISILSSGGCDTVAAESQLTSLSTNTGAIVPACADAGRTTLKYDIDEDGNGMDSAVVNGIDALIKYSVFDLYAETVDDGESSTPDTSLFIKKVEALAYIAPPVEPEKSCAPTATTATFNASAYPNGFTNFSTATSNAAKPGSQLTFTVIAENDFYKPGEKAEAFTANINIVDANTGTILDVQSVTIIVPPIIHGGGDS
ncbi:hypothetical protein KAH37_00500 [bacterium]|nr:hypothetical protein [bacterium]